MTANNKSSLRNRKGDLRKLVTLMNKQNKRFMPPFDPILKTIDLVITQDELDLLLKMGTDLYSYEQVAALSGKNSEKFNSIFESLKQKAFIGIKNPETSEEKYTLHPFVVGWFEGQASYLIGKPEEKEFAQRYMEIFTSLRNRNFFSVRQVMNVIGKYAPVSNQSVGMVHESKNAKGKSTVIIHETILAPDSKIYPTNSNKYMIMEYGSKNIIGQIVS